MKNIFKYLIAGAALASLTTACSDQLETSPTTAVSGTTMTQSNDAAMIALNGIYRSMYTSGWSTTGNTHQCFGISAYNLCSDVMGDDNIMHAQGSGWFFFDAAYNVKARYTSSAWRSYDLWYAGFTWIANANYLIAMDTEEEITDVDRLYILGQAYGVRAYSYWMLAQYFSRTYKGHESDPCVPLYNEPTTASTTGQPRATNEQVYAQMAADAAKAVDYLSRSQNTTLEQDKSFITYPVALGLQARIALTMEDWNTAATAAETAINLGQHSIQPVSASAFKANTANFINTYSSPNVMWGANIIADQSGIYASLYAHMDVDAGMYAGYDRAVKKINPDTYALMSASDSRRCWWDPNDANVPYTQHKFNFSDMQSYLGDYIWMRIEEMYLIAAEAECMKGNEGQAKQYLNTLVQTRDASYDCSNKTGTSLGALTSDRTGSLREAIIDQRRIELWGEYGRLYDIRRLRQGFKRTSSQGWPSGLLIPKVATNDPESYAWVLTIPKAEFDGNENMDEKKDQNPTGDYPAAQ